MIGVTIILSQDIAVPAFAKFYKSFSFPLALNFLVLYALNFDLISCFRLSLFVALCHLLTTKKRMEYTTWIYLEHWIKTTLLVTYSALSLTLFVSFDSIIFRVFLALALPAVAQLLRTISFDIEPFLHNSWANRTSLEVLLIAHASVCWVLFVWGWKSMFFLATTFSIVVVLSFRFSSRSVRPHWLFHGFLTFALIISSILSRFVVEPFSSDYILSYDQIFRGSIATGLTRWGIHNSNFGFGHQIPYHWLGESITGILSRVSNTSEIESVTRLAPYFGMTLLVFSFFLFLMALEASVWVSIAVTVFTAGFINQVDPASIGTLFGAAVFFATLIYVLTGIEIGHPFRSTALIALLAGLTILCQSVLGFILTISIMGLFAIQIFTTSIKKSFYFNSIILLSLVSVLIHLIFFRANTLLEGQQLISINNLLRFPGVPIELGNSVHSIWNAIRLNSFVFVLYQVAIFGIALFGIFRTDVFGVISKLFAFQLIAGLLLLNLVNLGEFSGKFMAPIGLLGTFLGYFTILQFLEVTYNKLRTLLFLVLSLVIVGIFRIEGIHNVIINDRKGLLFLFFITLAFLIVLFSILQTRLIFFSKHSTNIGFLGVILCSTFFVLHNIDAWQASRVLQARSSRESMFDSTETRDCLGFLRTQTPKSSIIATSLWRIPGGTDEKYFLTSLMSHRMVILDGPVYAKGLDWPSIEYFEDLKDIHTSFSNSLDRQSHDQLVSLGATHFLLDTRADNPDRTWSSLSEQNVVFGNKDCSVIKL
jgi:hypothetical protein